MRVDDLRRSALSKERAFLVAVAHVASVILDHAFEKKLFSATSLVVSSSYAIASGHFLAATLGLRSGHPLDHDVIPVGIGTFLGGLLAARWPTIAIAVLSFWVTIFSRAAYDALFRPTERDFSGLIFVPIGLVGAAWITSLSSITRWSLRGVAANRPWAGTVALLTFVTPVIAIALAFHPPALGMLADALSLDPPWRAAVIVIPAGSLVMALPGIVVLLLAMLMLGHRAFWPLVDRPLYALARHGVLARPKLTTGIAVVLCSLALAPLDTWWTVVATRLGMK